MIDEEVNLTPIQEFYSKTNIFITGATGFLGKILVEKLLRSCPNISTIYLLVRNKKGKDLQSRVEEIFDDIIFEPLKELYPKYRYKIVGVAGDCSLPDLGLSEQDRQVLINEVNIIFHVAATVRFDEKLKLAVAINVRSPLDILNLSKKMINLKSFIHVSTVYGNVPQATIEEKIYPSPIDSKKLILLAESMPDEILDQLTPKLLDKWPNTYCFTKMVAEDTLRQECTNLPLGIFRPAVVIGTYREPIRGWINNMYGPTGVCAGAGTGVLRTLNTDASINANIVPVDLCVNSIIASAWEVGTTFKNNIKPTNEIPVYNYVSCNDNPISWGEFLKLCRHYGFEVPSSKAIWFYSLTLQSTRIGYLITLFLLHYLPAIFVDLGLLCVGRKPKMLKIYKKIHKFADVLSYFGIREWKFHNNNVTNLIDKMTDRDKEIFFCDIKKLDWTSYFQTYMRGIRVYLLKDSIDTLPYALVKWRRLYWAHQCVKTIAIILAFRILWWFLTFVFL